MRILNQLEVEAASVDDPVEYVRNAAANAEQPEAVDGVPRKRKAGAGDGPPEPSPAQGSGIVAKRIRVLNNSGKLSQPIEFRKVSGALSSIGIGQAMTILRGLEEVAQGVRDPTAYVQTAVRSAGGVVPADDDADAEEDGAAETFAAPLKKVKQESGGPPASHNIKSELGGRDFRGAKTEELTETEKIERHVGWLNRNKQLARPLDLDEVLPALDCIGFRQSMRVLRRLEENCANVPDPNEYIKDLVARSGWIWAKPDIVDEDERVAKRVSWLNQFGMLQQPIDYAQVADSLDGLKVPHAMVLLRELEVSSHKVDNPTEYIRKAIGLAGEDEVQISLANDDSSVARHITTLNQDGKLAKSIDYSEVGKDLARIGEDEALKLLQELARKGASVKDPTGFIKFKLKAKLASLGTTMEDVASDGTKILKRVEWLNDFGGLLQDIDYNRVAAPLEHAGFEHAMTILKELEDKREQVRDPSSFILSSLKASWKKSATPKPPAGPSSGRGKDGAPKAAEKSAVSGVADLKALSAFMNFLQQSPRVKKPIKFGEIASALDSLGAKRALQIVQQMQEKGLGLDDPLTYIRAAAQRSAGAAVKKEKEDDDDGDDVAKITKRLRWLNQFAGLSKKIRIGDVVGALYCLGVPQTMEILRELQEKGQRVSDPTWYIKAAVQRANGVAVTPAPRSSADAQEAEEEVDQEEAWQDDLANEEDEDESANGVFVDFQDPEGDDDEAEADGGAEPLVEYDLGEDDFEDPEAPPADDMFDSWPLDEQDSDLAQDGEANWSAGAPAARQRTVPKRAPEKPSKQTAAGPKRVVGSLSGATGKLVPQRAGYSGHVPQPHTFVKSETPDDADPQTDFGMPEPKRVALPMGPQEKMVQVRDFAVKHGLNLDQPCLKMLARLPFYKAKDLIDDVLLGGKDRRGVRNPSKYLMIGCEKMSGALGVEQGIAMELAVSLGVVLNNDALDELASIPRKQSVAIIRELSVNPEACEDFLEYIKAEVLRCRAEIDSRPWPPAC